MTKPSPKFNLLALELENFQSIIDPVRIEFSDITLLYGPNSAGKSAVFDALELAYALWNPKKVDPTVITNMLEKWAHIPKQRDILNRSVRLAVEIKSSGLDPLDSDGTYSTAALNRSYRSFQYGEALWGRFQDRKLRFEFEATKKGHRDRWQISDINVSEIHQEEDGTLTLREILSASKTLPNGAPIPEDFLLRDRGVAISIPHTDYSKLPNFPIISKSDFFEQNFPSTVDVQSEFIFTKVGLEECSIYTSNWAYDMSHEGDDTEAAGDSEFLDTYLDHVCYFGGLLCYVLGESFPTITPDRHIPTPETLLLMHSGLNLKGHEGWHVGLDIDEHQFIKLVSDRMPMQNYYYKTLSELARIHKISYHPTVFTEYPDDEARDADDEAIADYSTELIKLSRINRYLSDYLFIEKGYQIDCDILFVSPIDYILNILESDDVVRHPSIVRLRLIDSDGRLVEIQDVGSGIPFVLPVLVSISVKNISTIQQPELHLHPALQSSLADIFIDRIRENTTLSTQQWQSIVETHSEHFLLRLLRRIRDTELETSDTALSLRPDDVAVYYFNPIPSGTTEVRKMLISPLGDFYNTWPRGFFDERNEDLFK